VKYSVEKFYKRIKSLITYTILSGIAKLERKKNYFETFAFDIIFDEQLNPYLMEVNQPYAIEGAYINGLQDVIPKFVEEALDLVISFHEAKESE
jgi:hypothetical protein